MPDMSEGLVQWLREQLDNDAELAASGESWSVFDEVHGTRRVDVDHSFERVVACTRAWRGEHIARHDPAQTLREVDAKRELLDEHADVNDGSCGTCVDGHWGYPTHGGSSPQRFPCRTLRLLALPYSGRPGYHEEWRP